MAWGAVINMFIKMRGRTRVGRRMQALVQRCWNELTPAGSPFRFKVVEYNIGNGWYGRQHKVVVDNGPLYDTHNKLVLSVVEALTQGGDWQLSVYAFNDRIACYEDGISKRFRGWAGRNLVKKIRERDNYWGKDSKWSEMQRMIVRVMLRLWYESPAENVRMVVRECWVHWRSLPCEEAVE